MALPAHETLAVAGSVVSPARTLAQITANGGAFVWMSTTADVRFTVDGQTNPVVTGGFEVGALLRSTDLGASLTVEEFLNLRILDVSTDARVQFEFLAENKRLVF